MLTEVREAKEFFKKLFGEGKNVPHGIYAIPKKTSRGKAYMRVKVSNDGNLSCFDLWWDEALTLSWYDFNKDGTAY